MKTWSRLVVVIAAVCAIWLGATGVGLADLRIVETSEGGRTETLFKRNRVTTNMDDDHRIILFCERKELLIISSSQGGRYWHGSFDTYEAELQNLFSVSAEFFSSFDLEAFKELEDMEGIEEIDGFEDLTAILGELFSPNKSRQSEEISVSITKIGEETVAGYPAEHYVIVTGMGDQQRVFEELWVSETLLDEVKAEAAGCEEFMADVSDEFVGPMGDFGMGELAAVLNSPEYQALLERGYVVRRKEFFTGLFGDDYETLTEVVEVSNALIAEDIFEVPAGYQRVDSLIDVLDL